jgi:hypothetical protein
MGYYKQQEIANQLEVSERVPRPRPASSHVSLTVRRREMRKPARDYTAIMIVGSWTFFLGAGVLLGRML